ncbi:MAG TPA: prolyl oligopeptidase family serine peptidase [Caldilineaceae bacterium]|nr:prolyl oligopeptidase family serine peptidase [Caldilineaceae bacterium]
MSHSYHIEKNLVYGMVSGTALLGDLYRPSNPNGIGLLHISGSGWHAPTTYNAIPLKESPHVTIYVHPLAEQGFTIFTINHRAAPTFRYPAALHDAQRAVRFFRHHAKNYGIDPNRIGALGGSSGGHLVSMLGTMDGTGNADAEDPIEREHAGVQCLVTRAAPVALTPLYGRGRIVSFLGRAADPAPEVDPLYREASPITYVSAQTPPVLLIHGTNDDVVPFEQSTMMQAALDAHGVPNRLIAVEGAGHGPTMPGAINPPDLIEEIAAWFGKYLG